MGNDVVDGKGDTAVGFGFTDSGEIARLADDNAAVGRRAIEGGFEGVVEAGCVHIIRSGSDYMSTAATGSARG